VGVDDDPQVESRELERHSSNRERAWQGCRDGVG